MDLSQLIASARDLPRALSATEHSKVRSSEYRYDPRVETLSKARKDLRAHCRAQVKVLEKLKRAFERSLGDDTDVILFLIGSVARLEYIEGVSDIDILGLTTRTRGKRRKLTLEKLEERLRRALGRKDIEVSAVGSLTRRDYYTVEHLCERLGRPDEPSWAVFNRGSIVFESVLHSRVPDANQRVSDLRSRINDIYCVSKDLSTQEFPTLSVLLLGYLTKSGILAKFAKLKQSPISDGEILKVLGARVWSSTINAIFLHVLYWESCILPKTDPEKNTRESIQRELLRSPMHKAIKTIPNLVARIQAHVAVGRTTWHEELMLTNSKKERAEHLIKTLYSTYLGPYGKRVDGGMSDFPMFLAYVRFFRLSMRARKRSSIVLNARDEKQIASIMVELHSCLVMCEKLTLLLARRPLQPTSNQTKILRLFGHEVFDKAVFAAELAT